MVSGQALSAYNDTQEQLQPDLKLTNSEWRYLNMEQIEIPKAFKAIDTEAFVEWVSHNVGCEMAKGSSTVDARSRGRFERPWTP